MHQNLFIVLDTSVHCHHPTTIRLVMLGLDSHTVSLCITSLIWKQLIDVYNSTSKRIDPPPPRWLYVTTQLLYSIMSESLILATPDNLEAVVPGCGYFVIMSSLSADLLSVRVNDCVRLWLKLWFYATFEILPTFLLKEDLSTYL